MSSGESLKVKLDERRGAAKRRILIEVECHISAFILAPLTRNGLESMASTLCKRSYATAGEMTKQFRSMGILATVETLEHLEVVDPAKPFLPRYQVARRPFALSSYTLVCHLSV